ncbi:GNAT family N-acetyltransferase [Hydrococcus rivularis NIES-593]|uniref:GNAT family N-acetyltransferase n=1 Tax=Hydrococcus rivularis NIES-593 TaxID=1921803 RepID=A0A1U7HPX6_9CYAN|nr:GNAT family N-acetyltransferase [Hydrococcus rivularis]OKH25653.1 GNAT family N-acetyltransferase [Hydrococcus rivularis NIES-593]
MNNLQIKQVNYFEESTRIHAIRRSVFQEEQGVAPEIEFDGRDETAIHFLAYLDSQPIGTIRIRFLDRKTAKIERLALLPSARGKGIGKKLMKAATEIVEKNKDYEEIIIHAQEYIKELHKQLGFEPVGEPFYEAGILHIKMIKRLVRSH